MMWVCSDKKRKLKHRVWGNSATHKESSRNMQQFVKNTRKNNIFMGQRENIRVEKEQRRFAPFHCCQNMFFVVRLLFLRAHHNTCSMRTRPEQSGWLRAKERVPEIKPMCNKHEEWFVLKQERLQQLKNYVVNFFKCFSRTKSFRHHSNIVPHLSAQKCYNISTNMKLYFLDSSTLCFVFG